jgi:hypothetical protein
MAHYFMCDPHSGRHVTHRQRRQNKPVVNQSQPTIKSLKHCMAVLKPFQLSRQSQSQLPSSPLRIGKYHNLFYLSSLISIQLQGSSPLLLSLIGVAIFSDILLSKSKAHVPSNSLVSLGISDCTHMSPVQTSLRVGITNRMLDISRNTMTSL